MANLIQIKRSVGTNRPDSLEWGELAYIAGIGSYSGINSNRDRVFVGDNNKTVNPIGGYYYTSMMDHQPGVLAGVTNLRNEDGGIIPILNSNKKIDEWNVGNLRLNDNRLSSTNSDGDIYIVPDGIGKIKVNSDTFISVSEDAVLMRYDSIYHNWFEIFGSNWFFDGPSVTVNNFTNSSSKDNGAFVVSGGAGIGRNLNIGGDINVSGVGTIHEGAHIGNVSILNNLINTSIGNLTIDSQGGDTTINDNARITGTLAVGSSEQSASSASGAFVVSGGAGVGGNLFVGGQLVVSGNVFNPSVGNFNSLRVSGNSYLGDFPSTLTVITGIASVFGSLSVDQISITENIISSKVGSGGTIYIDPYPDQLNNKGIVVIKGDLQVDGTTFTINSTDVSIDSPIIVLGDVKTTRTVVSQVGIGTDIIYLDSVSGINTYDVVDSDNILHSYVLGYNPIENYIQIGDLTVGIVTDGSQLKITHGYNTSTDRGVSFNYNLSSGISNNRTGFFGYVDNTNYQSSAPVKSWTYIPDATITNSVVSGTRGFLDIKGIYYQTGDYTPYGIVYFDVNGLQTSTNSPSSPSISSKQILTSNTEITLDFSTNVSTNEGDLIYQENSGAYGIVKNSGISSSINLIGVEGSFTNTYNLLKNGVSTNKIPSSVTTIYTNKPMWSSTLDGGSY